jgi:hypothetical protein
MTALGRRFAFAAAADVPVAVRPGRLLVATVTPGPGVAVPALP